MQFTARKRDPFARTKYRWHHGPFPFRGAAEEHAARMRTQPSTRGRARVEVVPEHHQARKRYLAKKRPTRVPSAAPANSQALEHPDAVDRATIAGIHRKRSRHAERTRAGMAAAAAAGARLGRPPAKLNVERAREIFAARSRAMGREEAWRFTAEVMKVSISTLKRALRSKGVESKGGHR